MIIAIVGPDRVGKTTLYNALLANRDKHGLRDAVFVPALPFNKELVPHLHLIDPYVFKLWDCLHDPNKLYVCDRHPYVDSEVYATVYGRMPFAHTPPKNLHPVLLQLPTEELLRRRDPDDPDPDAVYAAYELVLRKYHHLSIDAQLPLTNQMSRVETVVAIWRNKLHA